MNPDIFAWLLIESNWWHLVTQLESKLQQLRREATTVAGGQAFAGLTGLRRQLADAYAMFAETRDAVDKDLKASNIVWHVEGKDLSAEQFWSEERESRGQSVTVSRRQAQSIDIRDLPTLLGELSERIKIMTRTVNEEIQMVIGSVQVEDARVMRRQTEWTVVLAVLAAIYLPMTLVTGIFGMNITEIGDDITAPDRWSVVKAWGIVFGATMGSVLVYAVARYVLRYRRVGGMLLRRMMMNIGDGWLYRRVFAFNNRLQQLWLYRKFHGFREKMREWDLEAQKMEKME
jgi:Mg2+ and Co2+ transporter CorA